MCTPREERIDGVDAVVLSTGRVPLDGLGEGARRQGAAALHDRRCAGRASARGGHLRRAEVRALIGEPGAPATVNEAYFRADGPEVNPLPADLARPANGIGMDDFVVEVDAPRRARQQCCPDELPSRHNSYSRILVSDRPRLTGIRPPANGLTTNGKLQVQSRSGALRSSSDLSADPPAQPFAGGFMRALVAPSFQLATSTPAVRCPTRCS